jgi:hypothetical protein
MRTSNLALSLLVLLAAPVAVATGAVSRTERSKPAAQIFADSEKAMLGAPNFHVRGFINQGGQGVSLNLTVSPSGGGGSIGEPGVTMEVVVAAHDVYVKADEKSWLKLTGSEPTAELVANRWIEAPVSNQDFSPFARLAHTKTFMTQLTSGTGHFLSKLPVAADWGGHKAIILTDTGGDRLYVVDGTTPYMLHIQGGSGGSSSYVTFSDFGTAPLPTIPVNPLMLPGS